MHVEVQCASSILLSEQCHSPNLIMLVVFACSCVFHGGEALCEVLRVLCLLFIIVSMCAVLLLFVIISMCRFQKSRSMKFNAQWSSTHAISSFKGMIPCPWPKFVGVFYLLMSFSWSWLVCEALVVSHLLYSSMIRTLMFCVCTVLFIFNIVLCV